MKYSVFLFLFTLLLNGFAYCQKNDEILAKIGDNKITVEDFKNRYDLVPRIVRNANEDSAKIDFLYSMIAEKLLAEDALLHKTDTTEIYKSAYIPLEKMFVRDILFKLNVANKISYTNDDVIAGINKSKIILQTNVITVKDSSTIFKYYKQLKAGLKITDFFKKNFGSVQPEYPITFGQLDNPDLENLIYALKEKQCTVPFKVKTGWIMFYLVKRTPNPNVPANIKDIVVNTIKVRLEKKAANSFLGSILGKEKVEIDGKAFSFLIDSTANKFVKNITAKDSTGFILSETGLWDLLNNLTPAQQNQVIIKFSNSPASVKDILYYLMQEPVIVKIKDRRTIITALKNALDLFIENELTSRYGYEKGAQNLPEVKHDIASRRDNLLMQLYRLKLSEDLKSKISKETNFSKDNYNDIVYHVWELLTVNLNLIDTVFSKLKESVPFETLAGKYTIRTKPNSTGDLGYISASEYGDIGKIASTLSIGQIYGPVKTTDGYSIFKLIDKKENKAVTDSVNNNLRSKIIDSKVEEEIQKYIAGLAGKQSISINKDALKNVELSSINTLTYRYMGFGGRIIAEPLTYPMYNWVKYLKAPLF
jgi:hypothetical protein